LDVNGEPRIVNPTARVLIGLEVDQLIDGQQIKKIVPEETFTSTDKDNPTSELFDLQINSLKGEGIPVHLYIVELESQQKSNGKAIFLTDMRLVKTLEKEKLDAERLAAVGQTVAGLAHTIKNLLMGLEGGMYMVDSGLRRGDATRITEGWGVLQRNFNKTTDVVKDFLAFSKGKLPQLQMVDPNQLIEDIISLYKDTAKGQNVALECELGKNIGKYPLDPKGMEACITNLVSNSIDAVVLNKEKDGRVVIYTSKEQGNLIFKVTDNGAGMDWKIKQKVFTTFFTTKGGKGTGLGLLTTRKIVQEHGGTIELESNESIGSTFRIILPIKRLKELMKQSKKQSDDSVS